MPVRTKPPAWFWVVGILLLLWGIVGVAGFHIDLAMTGADRAKLDRYDQHFYTLRPNWFVPCYGIAVWTGLVGSILLLARRDLARLVYIVSLVAAVIMFGWMLAATDIIQQKGVLAATGLPAVIVLVCAFEIWLVGLAQRRGWVS
jgi:hypothetical protein